MGKNSIAKASWLLRTVLHARRITLEEIQYKWELSLFYDGRTINRSTIWRYRNIILEIYEIEIHSEHGFYFISDYQNIETDHIRHWLYCTISYAVTLSDCRSIQDRILLEPHADDQEIFATVTEAMRQARRLQMRYNNKDIEADPFCVKYFSQRWYLLARTDGRLKTYALERIQDIRVTQQPFKLPATFDAQDHYRHSYGIMSGPDLPPAEQVVLRIYGREIKRFKEVPWHLSQEFLCEKPDEDYAIVALFVHPTFDLIGRILSRADGVEVLQPEHLRLQVQQMMKAMLSRYT